MKIKKNIFVFILLFLISVVQVAFAQETVPINSKNALVFRPAYKVNEQSKFIYEAKPGDILHDKILIGNLDYKKSLTMKIFFIDGKLKNNIIRGDEQYESHKSEIGKWGNIDTGIENYTLRPREIKYVDFTIKIPNEIENKTYYGLLISERLFKGGSVNTAIHLNKNIELKVTDNPKPIEKVLEEIPKPKTIYTPTWFFYTTTGIFLLSMLYLLFSTIRKKKNKNNNDDKDEKNKSPSTEK